MKITRTRSALVLAAMLLPLSSQAHKGWLQPSKTVLNVGQWVTVDAGSSTDPFVKDHNAMRLENLLITAPDSSTLAAENLSSGKLRSTFDLQLKQPGTYRLAVVSNGLNASWEVDGQRKSWPPRGQPATPEGFAKEVPAKADKLKVVSSQRRLETFVTAGKPTAVQTSGVGLELVVAQGVNDLYSNEPATLQFLLDGKPAPKLKVELIADGVRYRNSVGEIELVTDADGKVNVQWPQPGLYWLSTSVQDQNAAPPATERRASYTATLEVLSP